MTDMKQTTFHLSSSPHSKLNNQNFPTRLDPDALRRVVMASIVKSD